MKKETASLVVSVQVKMNLHYMMKITEYMEQMNQHPEKQSLKPKKPQKLKSIQILCIGISR